MRRLLLAILAVSILLPAGAHASVTTDPAVGQSWYFNWGTPLPSGGFRQIDFFATNVAGGTYDGNTFTPAANFKASATDYSCDQNWTCTSDGFGQQQVSPTSLQVDPAGNSIRFTGCLNPSSGGACRNFDITAVRPKYLYQCLTCSVPDAWFDPTSNQTGLIVYAYAGLSRSGYTISGTFNGSAMPVINGFGQDTFNEYLFGPTVAVVP